SVPGYGLKEIEAFLNFKRDAEIRDGASSIVEYERYVQTGDQAILDAIAAYNEEDCVATRVLRDWLLERREEAIGRFGALQAPKVKEGKPPTPEKLERERLRDELDQSGDPALELAAGLIHYHERERKPVWWAVFDRAEMTPGQLLEDRESIGLVTPVGEPEKVDRSLRHTFTFPAQEHKLSAGHRPYDPVTVSGAGEILELDRETRVLVLRRGPTLK